MLFDPLTFYNIKIIVAHCYTQTHIHPHKFLVGYLKLLLLEQKLTSVVPTLVSSAYFYGKSTEWFHVYNRQAKYTISYMFSVYDFGLTSENWQTEIVTGCDGKSKICKISYNR